jgi:threonine dehydrogenase-like Zn-dependent dehydrogenase
VLRVPLADGTLVADARVPSDDLIPSLLAASDVLGTGWFAADAANVGRGKTVAVVGDGAVGLLGVLSAKQMGAERIIAMSRHEDAAEARPRVRRDRHRDRARRRGRGPHQGLTNGLGAHSVLECVGTQESMMQAIRSTRPAGTSATSASPRRRAPRQELFFAHVHLHGGPAPVRRYLPELIDLVWTGRSTPARSST